MLLRALAVSLLCHFVLLSRWSIPEREVYSAGAPSANLQAALVSGLSRKAATSGDSERLYRSADEGGRAARNKLVSSKGNKVAVQSQPRATASPAVGDGSNRSVADIQATPVGSEPAVPDGERRTSSVTTETPSPDFLRQYRLALAREARRHKRYPSLARTRGWEGLVTIAIRVPLPGAAPTLSIEVSSGVEYLDALALEMIGLSVRAVDLPEGLKGRAFAILVPVRYALDE